MRERRVLFLPINILSSMTRQIMCARAFRERGFAVFFAGQGDYLEMARREGFEVHELLSMEPGRLVARLRSLDRRISSLLRFAHWAWKELDLERLVHEEISLFHRLRPGIIISEERVSAVLSARITSRPHASLRNAYRTVYSTLPLMDMSGTVIGRIIRDPTQVQARLLKAFSWPFVARINRVLRSHGIQKSMRFDDYVESDDLVFLCDVPEFSPTDGLPPNYHYVGPLFWENSGYRPEWMAGLSEKENVLYISLGSTGTPELLDTIIRELKGRGYPLVVTFGGPASELQPGRWGEGVFAERFMEAGPVLQKASAVLCHGGNGTIYQALANAVPVIGIPTHLEQRFNARRLDALGVGKSLEWDRVKAFPEVLLNTLDDFQNNKIMMANVRSFQRRIQRFHAPRRIVELTESFLRC